MEPVSPTLERVGDEFVLREMFWDAESAQFEMNRRAARQGEYLADVLDFARAHAELYVKVDFDPRLARQGPLSVGMRRSQSGVRFWRRLRGCG